MDDQNFSEELRRYIGLALRWAWLIALATVLFGGAAYLVSARMTPVYAATTRVWINEAPATRSSDYSSLLMSERLARTYSELLATTPVLEQVIADLQLDLDAEDLRRLVEVQLVRDTQLIDVTVENTSPFLAAEIANQIVTVFAEQNELQQSNRFDESKISLQAQMDGVGEDIARAEAQLDALEETDENRVERNRLEQQISQYRQTLAYLTQSYESIRLAETNATSNVINAERAQPPEDPVRPRTLTNTVLAAFFGIALSLGGVFLIEALDDSLNPNEIERLTSKPVLGVVARFDLQNNPVIVKSEPRSPVAEAFRSLRTNIQFASVDRPLRTILVTSASPEDGKSTVAANLAASLAQSGMRVALLDADLRRPQVHKRLNLPNHTGVSAVFVQPEIALNGALQKTDVENLAAITSGDLPPNPAELLASEKMARILAHIGEQVDVVVLDTPPVLAVTDAVVLAPRVDGVVLVAKPGRTKQAAFRQALEQLERAGANLLGIILNDVEVSQSRYRYSYYRSYYTYGNYYGEDKRKNRIPIVGKK